MARGCVALHFGRRLPTGVASCDGSHTTEEPGKQKERVT
jgi:hypothetical protein